jgi:Skp family chaperone for outer membrane proteins
VQELQQQLQQEFQVRLEPVLQEIGREKGLHFIFNGPDAGLVWADAALDISTDVIKKLDAGKAAGSKPPVQ